MTVANQAFLLHITFSIFQEILSSASRSVQCLISAYKYLLKASKVYDFYNDSVLKKEIDSNSLQVYSYFMTVCLYQGHLLFNL